MCIFLCSYVSGTSDPYVKIKIAGKEVFRSKIIHKNLNPVWDERVCLIVDNLQEPVYIKVKVLLLLTVFMDACYQVWILN